jgi:hypothetical protein
MRDRPAYFDKLGRLNRAYVAQRQRASLRPPLIHPARGIVHDAVPGATGRLTSRFDPRRPGR